MRLPGAAACCPFVAQPADLRWHHTASCGRTSLGREIKKALGDPAWDAPTHVCTPFQGGNRSSTLRAGTADPEFGRSPPRAPGVALLCGLRLSELLALRHIRSGSLFQENAAAYVGL